MPALQVRDFPATLYDELKECAARNHRSIAQQTIIAVEGMLNEAPARSSACAERGLSQDSECGPSSRVSHEFPVPFDGGMVCLRESRAAREARSRKRQQLFEECDEIPWKGGGLSTEDIVAMVREGRDRLSDRDWLALDPFSSQEESAKAVTL